MQNLFKEIKQKADDLVKEASELSELINTSYSGIKSNLGGVLEQPEPVTELFGISGREEAVALEMLKNDFTENVENDETETDDVEDLISKCDNEGIDGFHEERDRNL